MKRTEKDVKRVEKALKDSGISADVKILEKGSALGRIEAAIKKLARQVEDLDRRVFKLTVAIEDMQSQSKSGPGLEY
jgi:hypothetical protein